MSSKLSLKIKSFPKSPAVYLMKNRQKTVIYVGRASSLKVRVSSYFTKAHNRKTGALMLEVAEIDYIVTDSVLEAIILEAQLIKKYQPKYNIQQKDDRSFLYIVITDDEYPKVLVKRGKELKKSNQQEYQAIFGPFTSYKLVCSILKLVRKIFPYSTCKPPRAVPQSKQKRLLRSLALARNDNKPCFYYHLGQCPGVCVGTISKDDYKKIIRNFILFFQGRKKQVIKNLKKEMNKLSVQEKFEQAAKLRNQLYYLEHLISRDSIYTVSNDIYTVSPFKRIEGYDISNISGKYATGSMVVFSEGEPDKAQYRRFKIKTVKGPDDFAMLAEVIARRFAHKEWTKPDLILVDGGRAQVNTAVKTLKSLKFKIPVVGIAKGARRKRADLIFGPMSAKVRQIIKNHQNLLTAVRDQAHRFALNYHKKLRARF